MEHTIEIKKIINRGLSLGYLPDGMVTMTSYALPGETVRVREIKRTKKYLLAENIEILESSPHRVKPPCPYYRQCGGCNLQHVAYNYQLEIKQNLLQETFTRNKIPFSYQNIPTTVPSPEPFSYRHKIRLHINLDGDLGYHAAGSNVIIPVEKCLLATNKINAALKKITSHKLDQTTRENFKSIEFIHCPATDKVTLVLTYRKKNCSSSPPAFYDSLFDQVEIKNKQATTVQNNCSDYSKQAQHFFLPYLSYDLCWDSHCFFQVNIEQNAQLVSAVHDELAPHFTSLLDLYSGTGNFSLPAALKGFAVTGVEHNQRSIHWARHNSNIDLVKTRPDFICDSVPNAVDIFIKKHKRFQTIILDPPRQGVEKGTAAKIGKLDAEKIIYISCDPATLCRDLRIITKKDYRIKSAVPFDMFPQTHHIESFVVLEKN